MLSLLKLSEAFVPIGAAGEGFHVSYAPLKVLL